MKDDKIDKVATNTTRLNLFAIFVAIIVFFIVNYVGTEFLNYIFKTTVYVSHIQEPYVDALQEYVDNNAISMTDSRNIEIWVKENNISYFTISVERELIYGVTYVDEFMLSGNASDDLHKTWQYFSKIYFSDGAADVFIYTGFTEKYYTGMTIGAAVVAIVIGLFIIYYGVRNEMSRLQFNLENSKVAEKKARESKDKLIKSMAHDLRTPLTSLMAYAEIVKIRNESGTVEEKYIDKIIEKAMDIRNLSNQLFDFSLANQDAEIQMDSFFNVEDAIGDYLSEFCGVLQSKGYKVVSDNLYWDDKMISVNANFISRIMHNVMSNIVKYADVNDEIFIESQYENNRLGIIIENKVDISNKITESSGIGLQNIEMMMKKMKGKMEIHSNNDTFKVILWFPTIMESH